MKDTKKELISCATLLTYKQYSHICQKTEDNLLIVFGDVMLLTPRKIKDLYDYQMDRK